MVKEKIISNDGNIQLLDVRDMAGILKMSTRNVWRFSASKSEFPKPVRLGEKTVRWRLEDVQNYITNLN
jgi:predicted DNA-binding transcriptional regulator AlpA